jgi:glycosyltransferase involved in cell wall biosynthesis
VQTAGTALASVGKDPVRVAHIIGSTGLYGAEQWILAQMRHLDPARAKVSIINLVDDLETTSDIVLEAKKRGFPACDLYTGGRTNPLGATRLARLARDGGYSILHSHGYKADILGLIAARIAATRIVSTPHGWSKENDKKLMLYEQVGRRCLRFMDHVCPLSSAIYKDLRRVGIKTTRMTLISNFVDVQEIDAVPVQSANYGKRRIGFIGQFINRKGIDDLIEAFSLLGRSDCELFLIGDGPRRENILRFVKSRNGESLIHCLGYSARRLEYLKSFDVLVLPSLMEGIPRCVMEAHAARVPVVGTDIDGTRDLVLHEQTGLLVPPRNPSLLAQAINRILNCRELAARLATAGRKMIDDRFSAEQVARQYEFLYLSLARR